MHQYDLRIPSLMHGDERCNAREFKSGRELAAFLGLVPKHTASGGKTVMLGISKSVRDAFRERTESVRS